MGGISWVGLFENPENLIRLAHQVFSLAAFLGVGSRVSAPAHNVLKQDYSWFSSMTLEFLKCNMSCEYKVILLLLLSHFSVSDSVDPIDGSPPGSPVSGILQARVLEWVAISFSNAWKLLWELCKDYYPYCAEEDKYLKGQVCFSSWNMPRVILFTPQNTTGHGVESLAIFLDRFYPWCCIDKIDHELCTVISLSWTLGMGFEIKKKKKRLGIILQVYSTLDYINLSMYLLNKWMGYKYTRN